jgi:hypothetical protein
VAAQNGFEYIIQKGDSLAAIAKLNSIDHWQALYGLDENAAFRKDNPDYDNLVVGTKLFIPHSPPAVLQTGPQQAAVMPGNAVFIDTHMHIQSNSCAPLPIQWGVIKRNAFIRLQASRGPLTVAAGIIKNRFGQIGGYSSDKIAIIYTGTGKASPQKGPLWKVLDYTILGVAANTSKAVVESFQKVFQTDAGLKLLTQVGDDNFEGEFKEATRYYYKNNRIERIATCLLMDMSYSHYWGNFGLPITLPLKDSNAFINDFISGGPVYSDGDVFVDYTSTTETPILSETMPGWSHLYAKNLSGDFFSFAKQYDSYFQPKLTTQDAPGGPSGDSFISFSNDTKTKSIDSLLIRKEYVHIIQDLPKSETRLFEDYEMQKYRSIKAAMTFPLKMLPFFHYDPRRHFDKAKHPELLKDLVGKHAFYRLSKKAPYLHLTADETLNNSTYMSDLVNRLSDNESAYKELFFHPSSTQGIFWGVKMYPRLGFAPDNFKDFPQLRGLYKACADNKISVTAHCSRGPMNIADYVNYVRYGAGPKNASQAPSGDPIAYLKDEFWFADNFTSPANWENVLAEVPDLTLDLAHFGGSDIWVWMGDIKGFSGLFEDIEKEFPANPDKLPTEEVPSGSDHEKRDQLASLYYTWIRRNAELCNTKKNVYTDLACFVIPDAKEEGKNRESTMFLIAKNLAFMVNTFPNLKNKILVGSDWFMTENNGTVGVGEYFTHMFQMLKTASALFDDKFDAWHQFAVINPLKFMGLWKDGGKIDVGKCDEYVKRLQMWSKDNKMIRYFSESLPKSKSIETFGNLFVNYLSQVPEIKESKEILNDNNELLILGS